MSPDNRLANRCITLLWTLVPFTGLAVLCWGVAHVIQALK